MSQPTLATAERYMLPQQLAEHCLEMLQARGQEGAELFIALSARIDKDGIVHFRRPLIPEQTCHYTPHGLLVTIDGDAIFALNRDCYEHDELLAGQIHAHPDQAYHSGADDALAIVRLPGALSIVVPHFASGPLRPRRWSVHRLGGDGHWRLMSRRIKLKIK